MRFCDLFISYKIGLKEIKNTIPFSKLPFYRKIFVVITVAIAIIGIILLLFKLEIASYITLLFALATFTVFIIIDSKKKNLDIMLNNYYSPFSKKRMNMLIKVLQSYGIDIHNYNLIDCLIDETQKAQIQSDYLAPLKKPFGILCTIIIPILAYTARKIGDAATEDEVITIALRIIILIILIFSLILLLAPTIKEILYSDYNKYNNLIYDLRQLKIFYINENHKSLQCYNKKQNV